MWGICPLVSLKVSLSAPRSNDSPQGIGASRTVPLTQPHLCRADGHELRYFVALPTHTDCVLNFSAVFVNLHYYLYSCFFATIPTQTCVSAMLCGVYAIVSSLFTLWRHDPMLAFSQWLFAWHYQCWSNQIHCDAIYDYKVCWVWARDVNGDLSHYGCVR